MKILVINGSPKGEKSSTLLIANAFLEGMKLRLKDKSDIKIEIIHVNNYEIKHCMGCFCCWTKSPGKCVIPDDMELILPKIIEADILIWSFPLYYFGMPSKVKALLDRSLPMFEPTIIKRADGGYTHTQRYPDKIKDIVLISTAGLGAIENNFEALIKQFQILYEGKFAKILFPQAGILPHVNTDNYLSYVNEAGKEYAFNRSISDKTKENLNSLFYPSEAYVQMANVSWDIKDEKKKSTTEEEKNTAAQKFTQQMAALYNPVSFDGTKRVLEMYYTDVNVTYQLILQQDACQVLTSDFLNYTTRIETPLTVWQDISKGIYSGEQAMLDGKYKTFGDLKLLISWNRYFGYEHNESMPSATISSKSAKKSNMSLMLIPWFIIWMLLSIHPLIGGIAGIMTAVCLHFANYKWELTIFDYLTGVMVTIFSLIAILGGNMQIIISLSYLCFGLMWLLSCFTFVPLTAYYSKNEYNGEDALKNPLFLKTNLILTLCWAALYLVTPVWTYFILGSSFSYLIGIINSICPILLGLFTNWFQKWYPSYIASGSKILNK